MLQLLLRLQFCIESKASKCLKRSLTVVIEPNRSFGSKPFIRLVMVTNSSIINHFEVRGDETAYLRVFQFSRDFRNIFGANFIRWFSLRQFGFLK